MPKLKTSYQVWILGYNNDDCITDFDCFIREFDSAAEAMDFAKELDEKKILALIDRPVPEDVRYLHLQVETVKQHKNWEENVDTLYEDTFDLKEEEFDEEECSYEARKI